MLASSKLVEDQGVGSSFNVSSVYTSLKIETTSTSFLFGGVGAELRGNTISVTSKSSLYSVVSIAPPFATIFTE